MALTVVNAPYRQQRTPFWERVGTELLIPALSDLWKTHRQNEQNRKQNTMRGEFEKRKKALENMGQDSGSMGQSNGGFMNTPQMPEGYNSNAWANAFHNTDTPLTQFDMGTADILPPSAQSIQQAQQRKVLSPAEQRSIINELAGMYRFSNVSPDAIENLFAPDLKAAEEAYKRSQRDEAAQAYANAADALGKRDSAMEYAIRGITPENIAKMADDFYRYENPYYQESVVNTGGQQQAIRFNPRTGEYTTRLTFDNTLTPQQVQAGRQWTQNFEATRTDADRNYGLKEQELELKKRPKIHSIGRGDDGVMYMYFDDGSKQAVTPNTTGLSTVETQQVTSLEAKRKDLVTRHKDLTTALSKAATDEERAPIVEGINNIAAEIKGIDSQISSIYQEKFNPTPQRRKANAVLGTGDNIGLNMLSGNGTISSSFGQKRKRDNGSNHTHMGIDIAAKDGTEILMPNLSPSSFIVTKVANDVNGYGNYVDLRNPLGSLNGHTVELRIGHMQNNSVNVREGEGIRGGELIGLVGNTGNSRGKNGGYHMHLEIKIDGKHVDPATAWSIIQTFQQEEQKQQTGTQQTGAAIPPNTSPTDKAGTQSVAGQGNIVANNQPRPQQNNYADVINNPELNWTPNYQHINMPEAYTAMNVPMIEPQQTLPQEIQTEKNSTQPHPQPKTGSDIASVLHEANNWNVNNYDLSNAEFTSSLPGSGVVPRGATYRTPNADPDGGLTQYRAEGDNSPVAWRNSSGAPMRTSDGQLFTQQVYEDWARKADAGEYRDRKINSRADLDKWLEKVGMRKDTPSEQRGINNLNGNSNSNLPPENKDANIIPFNISPQTNPEYYPAPEYTDFLNGTAQGDMEAQLDGLNGERTNGWTRALRQLQANNPYGGISQPTDYGNYPNSTNTTQQTTSPQTANENDYQPTYNPNGSYIMPPNTGNQKNIDPRGIAPQQEVPQQATPKKVAPAPKKGRTSYELQRTHVDNAAKTHGIDSELIRAVIQTESGWNPNARSKVGAMGLMQLMPSTARELGVKNAYDPAQNIAGGSKYLAQLVKRYKGDISKALMAYNCGPGNVNKGRIPKASKAYAKKVMGIYRDLKGQL